MSVAAVESYLYVSESGVVAATALLVFDYCLTFKKEVEWLFGTKWTPARIHFTSSRYLPFVALALGIPTSLPPSETAYCGTLGTLTTVMYYICIALAEAMLIVRTYAFWNGNRRILVGMCTLAMICLVVAIVPSETIVSQPANPVYQTLNCGGVQGAVATALQYSLLVLYESCMLGLNWIAFRRMKKQNNPGHLITTLYRDGMMYIAATLLFSMMNAVASQYTDVFNSPQMVLHSILASRIFFNLRETARREQDSRRSTTLTEFHATLPTASDTFFSNSAGSSSSRGGVHTEITRESVVHVQDS